MDFRSNQQSTVAPRPGAPAVSGGTNEPKSGSSKGDRRRGLKNMQTLTGIGVIIVGILAALILVVWFTQKTPAEDSYVSSNQLQAVFLTNDQVYFGHIKTLNNKFLVLGDIYYLQTQNTGTGQTTTNNNVSLVKLGCELHKPFDRMVINRSEVEFWENLQSDGQVANAVKQFVTANPNGQKCTSTTNGAASGGAVQGTASTPATTTPTTTPKTGN